MIKIYLNKLQWLWLTTELKTIVETAPVKDAELESLNLAEMYRRKIHELTFYKPGKMGMKMSLTQVEGYALNNYFANYDDQYDIFLRPLIEPKLLAGK
jgi:hypothetical protein